MVTDGDIAAARAALRVAAEALAEAERRLGRSTNGSHDGLAILPDNTELVPLREVSRRLNKSDRTVRRWCERYKIGYPIGGRWMVNTNRLALFLEQRSEKCPVVSAECPVVPGDVTN